MGTKARILGSHLDFMGKSLIIYHQHIFAFYCQNLRTYFTKLVPIYPNFGTEVVMTLMENYSKTDLIFSSSCRRSSV